VPRQVDALHVTPEGDLRDYKTPEGDLRQNDVREDDVREDDVPVGEGHADGGRPEGSHEDAHDADARGPESLAQERAVTGEPRVDRVLGTLADIAEVPLAEHPVVFERIHGQLVEVLGELRAGPDTSGPGR